jgi:general secretion pathway protein N
LLDRRDVACNNAGPRSIIGLALSRLELDDALACVRARQSFVNGFSSMISARVRWMVGRTTMPKLTWSLLLVSTLCVTAPNAALSADNFSEAASPVAGEFAAAPLGESTSASTWVPSAPAVQPGGPARHGNPLWEVPFESLSVTRERPVFSSSRRPPPAPVTEVAVAKLPPPKPAQEQHPLQLSLVGTVSGGDRSVGIFVDPATKSGLRLRIGDEHQGWRLRAVQGREATFARDEQTVVLNFPEPGTGALAQRVEVADVSAPTDEPRRPHVHR